MHTRFLEENYLLENEAEIAKTWENLKKIAMCNFQAWIYLSVFVGHKSILRHWCIQNVEDRIQIWVNKTNRERLTHFIPFIPVKAKKIFRKAQGQFWENLRKLRLRWWFSYKNVCVFNIGFVCVQNATYVLLAAL